MPDERFPMFFEIVAVTLGKIEDPRESLAPVAWYRKHQPTDSQLSLFTDDPDTLPATQVN